MEEDDSNMEDGEGFEEWDADFLDQLIQVEEFAISSTLNSTATAVTIAPTTTTTSSYRPPPPQPQWQQKQPHITPISYSPPRELSQRALPSVSSSSLQAKDLEIDRLKRELGHVSGQLTKLESECVELRKKSTKMEDHGVSHHSTTSKVVEDQSGFEKNIGVQTDDFTKVDSNCDMPSYPRLSEKLQGIWGPHSDQELGRNLMSKLLITCAKDFSILFGPISMNMYSKESNASIGGESSSQATLQHHLLSFHTSKATEVVNLQSILNQICNQMLPCESMLQPLLSLCQLENAAVRCSSLRILHELLKCLLISGKKPVCILLRKNIKVEGHQFCSSGEDKGLFNLIKDNESFVDYSSFGTTMSSDLLNLFINGCQNNGFAKSPHINWVSLFESVLKISVDCSDEYTKSEAVSILNLILMSSNALEEREKFFRTPVFENIGDLLKKDSGSCVQKEALLLLFLLLNCPKILRIFCSADGEDMDADGSNDKKSASDFEWFGVILEGLSDCLDCSGSNIEGIEVRRGAVILLAFLASSGKPGFQVLVTNKLRRETNFLLLILQVLESETDKEESNPAEPSENVKARTLLIREVLILLNRLISNTASSGTVLQVLTASRDVASITVDIASRLSRKEERSPVTQSDRIRRQIRESDIVDLARVFKKRVFSYLGDKV